MPEQINPENFLAVNFVQAISRSKIINDEIRKKIIENSIAVVNKIIKDAPPVSFDAALRVFNTVFNAGYFIFSTGGSSKPEFNPRIVSFYQNAFAKRREIIYKNTSELYGRLWRFIIEYHFISGDYTSRNNLLDYFNRRISFFLADCSVLDSFYIMPVFIELSEFIKVHFSKADANTKFIQFKPKLAESAQTAAGVRYKEQLQTFAVSPNSAEEIINLLDKDYENKKLFAKKPPAWDILLQKAILLFYCFSLFMDFKISQKDRDHIDEFTDQILTVLNDDLKNSETLFGQWNRGVYPAQETIEYLLLLLYFSPGNSLSKINKFFSGNRINQETFDRKKILFEKLFNSKLT